MTRMKPLRFQDESNMAAFAFIVAKEEDTHEPLTYQEAVAFSRSSSWEKADELQMAVQDKGRDSSKAEIGSTKSLLKKEFNMMEPEEAKKILGMEIVRDWSLKILRVSQPSYVSNILSNFRIDNGKLLKMPLGGHFKLSLKDCSDRDYDVERMGKVPYANAIFGESG
ncbi:hypothetical protein Tco_1474793 [Tanacetum coccineum]